MENQRKSRRGTYTWLTLLGVAVGIILLAGLSSGVAIQAAGALIAAFAYLAVALFTLSEEAYKRVRRSIKMPPLRPGLRSTTVARKATQRAQRLDGFNPENVLTDVGMIFNKRQRDGSWDRQLITEDELILIQDAGVQPFAKINVSPAATDRVGIVSFEVYDQAGHLRFSRQTEQLMRPGDNTILCDRQLPLQRGDPVTRSGTWDLRVSFNGDLIGIHSFGVKPSTEQRRQYFNNEAEAAIENLKLPENEEGPMSLDDLLKQQKSSANRRR